MIKSQDIKKGTCIRMDGKLYFCIDFLHVKPGKGNTIMRTTLKDVVSGRVLEKRFNIGEALEDVRVERRPYQYLYLEGEDYIFMNQETYDQIPISRELITGVDFMKESDIVDVVSDADTNTILYAEMPVKTVLRITHSEPGIKGDTATNATKPATLETGVEVRVPLFVNPGRYPRRQLPAAHEGIVPHPPIDGCHAGQGPTGRGGRGIRLFQHRLRHEILLCHSRL